MMWKNDNRSTSLLDVVWKGVPPLHLLPLPTPPRAATGTAGHHPGDATTLGECTPPRTGSSNNGGVRLHPSSTPPRAPPSQVDLMTPSHNREFGGSSIFGTSLHLFFYWFIGLLPTVCISSFLLLSLPSHFFCSSMLALESLIF